MEHRKKFINNSGYPDHVIETVARTLLPSIIESLEDEAIQAEYRAWLEEQHLDDENSESAD